MSKCGKRVPLLTSPTGTIATHVHKTIIYYVYSILLAMNQIISASNLILKYLKVFFTHELMFIRQVLSKKYSKERISKTDIDIDTFVTYYFYILDNNHFENHNDL